MRKHYFLSDRTLFQNGIVFETGYLPEELHFRDTQLDELAFTIKPGLQGARPMSVICKGLPGTGKTASVLRTFAGIEEVTENLVPVYVNCRFDRTVYTVFARIYAKLKGLRPTRTGVSISSLVDGIGKCIQEKGIVLVVCLDDAEFLVNDKALDNVLGTLVHLQQDYPGVRVGVIATVSSPDVDLYRHMNPGVASIFRPTEIAFPRYTREEIRAILQARVEMGLCPGAVSPEVMDLVVEETMRLGDIRAGLALLKWTAMHAEMGGREQATADDVSACEEYARILHLSDIVQVLSPGESRLLRHITRLSGHGVLTSAGLFSSLTGRGKSSRTTFARRLRVLRDLRLVDMVARPKNGETSEIVLRFERELVRRVCG